MAAIKLIKEVQKKTGMNLLDLEETRLLQTTTSTSKKILATASMTHPIRSNHHISTNSSHFKKTSSLQYSCNLKSNNEEDQELYKRIQRAKMFAKSAKELISTPLPFSNQSFGAERSNQDQIQELYSQSTCTNLAKKRNHASKEEINSAVYAAFNSENQKIAGARKTLYKDNGNREHKIEQNSKFYNQNLSSDEDLILQFSPQN